MTLNEELRCLLDERGVEWEAFDVFEQTTQWSTYNGAFVYWARERDGKLLVETTAPTKCSASCTPELAVITTLGPGTCTLINAADDLGSGTSSSMCFECGYTALDDWWEEFNFCPNCGRKVVA